MSIKAIAADVFSHNNYVIFTITHKPTTLKQNP